ncbi:hypothetical protein KY285_016778 [Solanum tuberosum]|nr:hypothetical protein KY285_016778 [Solanum tuberosum]
MNQRAVARGRPSGTDGCDFSYRMVVDSRYTKVAKAKSRLAKLIFAQTFQNFTSLDTLKVDAVLLGFVVQLFAIGTAISLINNMAPPKRAS